MEIERLMSGIAVVIDDALDGSSGTSADDQIEQIVNWFEDEWKVPFVRMTELPEEKIRPNLLRSASFVLLDWRLWPLDVPGADMLRKKIISEIGEFLKTARENLVPVFILTNEALEDVRPELEKLPRDVYDAETINSNFVFVKRKSDFLSGAGVDVESLKSWVYGNASVYALKTWQHVMGDAKVALFQAMCQRSTDWPKIFWATYKKDGVDPSASLTNLINDSLQGRMQVNGFEENHLGDPPGDVSGDELRKLIAETSFLRGEFLSQSEVRCGDMYNKGGRKYWLNLRPDCDCIPRDGQSIDDVELQCVEGERLKPNKAGERVGEGRYNERIFQSGVFGVVDGESICFDLRKVTICRYAEFKQHRVGRLLHPYVTRVQQRYAFYIQRQALPRIPDAAIPHQAAPRDEG